MVFAKFCLYLSFYKFEITLNSLAKRILVSVIGIPLVIALIYFGGISFLLALIIVSSIALWEFYKFSSRKLGFLHYLGIIANVIIQLSINYYVNHPELMGLSRQIVVLIFLILILYFTITLFSKHSESTKKLSNYLFGISYVSFFFGSLNSLRSFNEYDTYGYFLLSIFIAVWALDSFAYFVGKSIGKRKLFASVSPNKTWEGSIGGFIGSTIAFTVTTQIMINGFALQHAIILGMLIGIFGQIGDLFESKLKRDANIKDSSNILPGHGGFLDRFDSMLFVSPIVYSYLIFVV